MLHIHSISKESIQKMLDIYNLPADCPEDICTVQQLIDFVINTCVVLIPERLRKHFESQYNGMKFIKSDMEMHLLINAFLVQLAGNEEIVKDEDILLKRIINFMYKEFEEENISDNLFGDKDILRNYKKYLSLVGDHWNLSNSMDEKKYNIPAFLSPLITYIIVCYDAHKVIKDHEDSNHSTSYLKKNKVSRERFHLVFYDNFKNLLDNFGSLAEKNEYNQYSFLNRIIFEREYNLGLVSKITVMTNNYPPDMKEQYRKMLSLTSLFPNINGRLYYVSSILVGPGFGKYPEEGDIVGEYLTKDEHLVRTKELVRSLLGMAAIVFPVMEEYFLYLWQKSAFSFNIKAMKEILEALEQKKFFDKKIQPASKLHKTKYDSLKKTYGYSMSDEWQLAELPYKDIKEVLNIINEISEIKDKNMGGVYLDPYGFLIDNGIDKYTLMLLKDSNISETIVRVSEVIEEKFSKFI